MASARYRRVGTTPLLCSKGWLLEEIKVLVCVCLLPERKGGGTRTQDPQPGDVVSQHPQLCNTTWGLSDKAHSFVCKSLHGNANYIQSY